MQYIITFMGIIADSLHFGNLSSYRGINENELCELLKNAKDTGTFHMLTGMNMKKVCDYFGIEKAGREILNLCLKRMLIEGINIPLIKYPAAKMSYISQVTCMIFTSNTFSSIHEIQKVFVIAKLFSSNVNEFFSSNTMKSQKPYISYIIFISYVTFFLLETGPIHFDISSHSLTPSQEFQG